MHTLSGHRAQQSKQVKVFFRLWLKRFLNLTSSAVWNVIMNYLLISHQSPAFLTPDCGSVWILFGFATDVLVKFIDVFCFLMFFLFHQRAAGRRPSREEPPMEALSLAFDDSEMWLRDVTHCNSLAGKATGATGATGGRWTKSSSTCKTACHGHGSKVFGWSPKGEEAQTVAVMWFHMRKACKILQVHQVHSSTVFGK